MTSLQIALNEKTRGDCPTVGEEGSEVDRKYVGYAREDSLNDREYMIQNRVVESNEQSMEKLRKSDLGFNTILQQAIVLGFSGLVDEMVKLPECPLEVSTNSCEPATNKTALHYACRVGNLEMVKLLVDNGSRVDDVDHHHRTPLFEACEHNHGDIVEYLIEKQANVEHKDDEGHTCLHTCCKHGSVACMTSLIARGAVLNSKDLAGRTPLIVASQFGQTECGRVLVKAFASMKKH
ncbi:hypothetical protein C9374_014222 [Naegleria lovaniensis]|uniref:Ankyrin repeat protein n=1 Tax=Naegleria lovaniensis TaxID=51637 RepID=A0AA88GED7_NAELO|nr:uncharacterized protein C9374_014222 [Naegleria lovaniensis]KAG2370807.1 hypothetical protein C9374_014222 [Naegleria lovaniensis]